MSEKVAQLFAAALEMDRAKDGEGTLHLLNLLLEYQPDHRLGLFYRGGVKIRYGDDGQSALEDWVKAFDGAPPGAVDRVQEMYAKLVETCLNRFARLTVLDPYDAAAHAVFARACYVFGRWEQAERHLQRAVELDGTRWSDGLALTDLRMYLGQKDEALQTLQKLLEANLEVPELHMALAAFHQAAGSLALTVRHLEATLKLDPAHCGALRALGDIYLQQGRFDQAESLFLELLNLAPEAAVHLGLAECLKQKYCFEEALEHYRQAVAADPHNFRALSDLGALALQFGDLNLGVESLRKALELEPTHTETYAHLAKAAQQQGDTLYACGALRQLLQLDPNDAYASYSLATLLRSLGDYRESSGLLRKALESRPGDVQVCLDLADCLVHLDSRGEALELLSQAFQRNPNHQELKATLLQLDPTAAMETQSRILSFEELVNLGRAHLQGARQEEALQAYSTALVLSPSDPECLLQVGRIYALRGLAEPAADLLLPCYLSQPTQLDLLLEIFPVLNQLLEPEYRGILNQIAAVLPQDLERCPWLEYLWNHRATPGVWELLPKLMYFVQQHFPVGHPVAYQWVDLKATEEGDEAVEGSTGPSA